MGYILIIVGLLIAGLGVAMISSGKELEAPSTDGDVFVATISHDRSSNTTSRQSRISENGEDHRSAGSAVRDSNEPDRTQQKSEPGENVSGEAELSSKDKGDMFEDYVVNLLADWRLKLLDRTQDKVSSSGVYAESCKNPDLHVQQKRGESKVDYYIECKYRSKWEDNGAVNLEDWQLRRYRDFQHSSHRKVLIALGVGGTPSKPQTFMIVPLDSIKSDRIRRIDTKYCVTPTSDGLVGYVNSYFNNVFNKKGSQKKTKESN